MKKQNLASFPWLIAFFCIMLTAPAKGMGQEKQNLTWQQWAVNAVKNHTPRISQEVTENISPDLDDLKQACADIPSALSYHAKVSSISTEKLFGIIVGVAQNKKLDLTDLVLDYNNKTPVNVLNADERTRVAFAILKFAPKDMQGEILSWYMPTQKELIELFTSTEAEITPFSFSERIVRTPENFDPNIFTALRSFDLYQVKETDNSITYHDAKTNILHIVYNKGNADQKLIAYDGPNADGTLLFSVETHPTTAVTYAYNLRNKQSVLLDSANGTPNSYDHRLKKETMRFPKIALCPHANVAVIGQLTFTETLGKFSCTLFSGDRFEQASTYTFTKQSPYHSHIRKIMLPFENRLYLTDTIGAVHTFNVAKRAMHTVDDANCSLTINSSYPSIAATFAQQQCIKAFAYTKLTKIALHALPNIGSCITNNVLPKTKYSRSDEEKDYFFDLQLFFNGKTMIAIPINNKADAFLINFEATKDETTKK
ncbi:MAG: hypothetical protein WCE21_00855 [Candidatus Babeliales bacterium]